MKVSKTIRYEDLTWPEIAALPRETPLVIPLGSGFDPDAIADALGGPSVFGILPALPYGWQASGLAVPRNLLERTLVHLLASLRDDGFRSVFAATPQNIDPGLGSAQISIPEVRVPLEQIPTEKEIGKVVLIPVGHTEQHGYHLPMSTDTNIIESIARGVAETVPDLATTLPVVPYGVSTHRRSFAGTLDAGGRAFEDFFLAVIDQLVLRGFDRFYFLNGHGGNHSFLVNVVKYAGDRYPRIFCATSWLYLSGPDGITALKKDRNSKIGGMGHAGELETSLLLHLQPDLVKMEKVVDETDFVTTPNYYMDWVEGGALIANPPWYDDTRTGAYGAGSLAAAEKGRAWLAAAISEKITHVREIHDQHTRRESRREAGYGGWGIKI